MNMMFSEVGVLFCFVLFLQEKGTKPAIAKKENGVDRIESAPQEQTNNDDLTCIDEAQQNDSSGNLVTIYELFLA